MKILKSLFFLSLMGLMVVSCQKDALEPDPVTMNQSQDFVVPDIPDEIAAILSDDDIAKFQTGPGEESIRQLENSGARVKHGRWHPMLMVLGYDLQFVPIGGMSCMPGDFAPCIVPGEPPDLECLANTVGSAGQTISDGYWLRKEVHAEYFPVFCAPEYTGYGFGYYQLKDGLLWLEAENGPFRYDEDGNFTFYRHGRFVSEKCEGTYEGAVGWEITVIQTLAENNPANDPQGIGYSTAVTFGWIYW